MRTHIASERHVYYGRFAECLGMFYNLVYATQDILVVEIATPYDYVRFWSYTIIRYFSGLDTILALLGEASLHTA